MPIPGHPPNTSYRTVLLEDFGIFMCGSHVGCPKDLGWTAHHKGRVDRAGTIHWKQADKRAHRRGMRQVMKMAALAFNRDWWELPRWKKLYLTNVWAWRTVQDKYHYRVKASWSYQDRLEAKRLIERAGRKKTGSLRRTDRHVFTWLLMAGLRVEYPSRGGDRPEK